MQLKMRHLLVALFWLCGICSSVIARSVISHSETALNVNSNEDTDIMVMRADPEKDVHFLLWTRRNPEVYQELTDGDATSLQASNFNAKLPTKVFVHGFSENGRDSDKVVNMRDAYLEKEDCNYLSVDWGKLASPPNYFGSAASTEPVGVRLGNFINFLVKQGALVKQFHLIGFSLGAHVVGKAGAIVDGVVPRITGLDPAYPAFSLDDTDGRLDTSDAAFVDVIHTNSGTLLQAGLSFPTAIGHVDFFANGGHSQPGCGLISGDLLDLLNGCSHGRAPDYFTESINSQVGFLATRCDEWKDFTSGACNQNNSVQVLMGEPISVS
jgi:hypothetical protein